MEKTKRLLVRRDAIGFIKSIIESYEDIGIISVIDGEKGLIEIIYSAFFEEDLNAILEDMKENGIDFMEVKDG
ncbi:MAG TPA: DUF4911 domain-containing protein [Syntrophorhabdaceae bacterium]|nr:DUF4911 domain-containing protein [Syntrophorhabdaceae bacterium]HPP07194.1 DUF4911 domain-containing protein [Syntrophorhabdaceae bacterium]